MQPRGLLKFLKLEGFLENLTEYIENKIAIVKLEYKQKLIDLIVKVSILAPVVVLGLIAFLFLNIGLAMGLNVWLDSRAWGFVIVGAFYLLLAVVLFTQRDAAWLKKKVGDGTTQFLKEKPKPPKKEDFQEPTYEASHVKHKKIIFEDEVPANGAATNRPPVKEETEPELPASTYGGSAVNTNSPVKEPKMASEVERYRTRTESTTSKPE